MTILYGTILFSVVAAFVISLVICMIARASNCRDSICGNFWVILFLSMTIFAGSFAFSRLYVCSGVYAEGIWKGREDQRTVKEVLVQDVPELKGADLQEIVFDLNGNQAVAIYKSNTIPVDGEAAEYIRSYFDVYHKYEYAKAAQERTMVLSMLCAAVMTFAGLFAGITFISHFTKKKREMERLL